MATNEYHEPTIEEIKAAARERIAELEADRNRLAQELSESQVRGVELVSALGSVSFRCAREGCQTVHPSQIAKNDNRIERALAHPSPAAEAIGKLIEVVACVYEQWADPRCAYFVVDMGSALTKICEAYRSVEDIRSGQGHEDQPPAEPAQQESKP